MALCSSITQACASKLVEILKTPIKGGVGEQKRDKRPHSASGYIKVQTGMQRLQLGLIRLPALYLERQIN